MSSLLEYKNFKNMPDSVKKQLIKEKIERYLAKNPHCRVVEKEEYERNTESTKPLSVEESPGDPVDTLEIDHQTNIPDELKNPKEHGGPTEVLVKRLNESREE